MAVEMMTVVAIVETMIEEEEEEDHCKTTDRIISHNSDDRRGGGNDRRGGYDDRRGGYDDRRGEYDDRRGGYDDRRDDRRGGYNRGYDDRDRRGGGGYNNNRNNRNSRHGYGRQGGGQGRQNELGYHGSLRKNQRIETELFGNVVKSGINFDQYDNIPIEVGGELLNPISEYTADVLGAPLHLLCTAQYSRPTPIQKYSIPVGSAGRDLMACAQTVVGKPLVSTATILVMLWEGQENDGEYQSRYPRAYPGALIAPTRRLASQIHDEAESSLFDLSPVVVYGGADVRQQMRELENL